jgi:hypothetical protein
MVIVVIGEMSWGMRLLSIGVVGSFPTGARAYLRGAQGSCRTRVSSLGSSGA